MPPEVLCGNRDAVSVLNGLGHGWCPHGGAASHDRLAVRDGKILTIRFCPFNEASVTTHGGSQQWHHPTSDGSVAPDKRLLW